MRKLTNDEFIEKCKVIHSEKYDYSKVKYINIRTNIIIICKNHGEFSIKPENHIGSQKQGCVKCAIDKHKLTQISEERLENIRKIHNNKYIYNDLSVVNGKIKIICHNHGEFTQSIYNHERGHGCTKCSIDSQIKIRLRVCSICNLEKITSEFYKNYKRCKNCVDTNKSLIKGCIKCGEEKEIILFPKHKDMIGGYRNECVDCFNFLRVEPRKIYRQKNKSSIRKYDLKYRKDRMSSDPFYRAKTDARNIIRKAIYNNGYSKKSRTEDILGCSFIEFKAHIESLFLENMNWDNRNMWEIDHITPLSFANNENEILLINNYKNLRPIWTIDNQLKSDKIEFINDTYKKIIELRSF